MLVMPAKAGISLIGGRAARPRDASFRWHDGRGLDTAGGR
jgi:hypothetical protein